MSWRTVIISNQAKLDYKLGYMVIRGLSTNRILVDEISVVVIENPAISITGCLLEALMNKKVKVIFCDSKRNPSSELIPHHGSHDSSGKIRMQLGWSDDVKATIWQEIISEKIRKQSELLVEVDRKNEAELLSSYIGQVEMLDATNREGHAAKVYFNALFGMEFTRSEDSPINAALNYGYSLILSTFNREISACGYLTQIGIFHSNMFNHFNLACDFMEPFRIVVDRMVVKERPSEFDSEQKHTMWKVLSEYVLIDGNRQMLDNAIRIYTKSVFDAINDNDPSRIKFYKVL